MSNDELIKYNGNEELFRKYDEELNKFMEKETKYFDKKKQKKVFRKSY